MRLVPDHIWAIITMLHETAMEPFEGKVAFAEVVLERTRRKIQSDGTIAGTCLWPMAFSGWNAHDPTPKFKERIEWAKADTDNHIVQDCLRAWSEAEAGSDLTHGATHYLNERLTLKLYGKLPDWVAKMEKTADIGNHSFYKEVH